jgi:hypothetical protein
MGCVEPVWVLGRKTAPETNLATFGQNIHGIGEMSRSQSEAEKE